MLLAGLRFPFPNIVQELLCYLRVALFQIKPNGWRYFLATCLLWPMVLPGHQMTIQEFFVICQLALYKDEILAFTVQ